MFCRNVLAPAVPSSVDLLPAYQDIVDKTELLHEYLVNNKFLLATNMTLLNYARNVDALFANKVCQVRIPKFSDTYVFVYIIFLFVYSGVTSSKS